MIENYDVNYRNASNSQLEKLYSDSRQSASAIYIKSVRPSSVLEVGCASNPLSNYLAQMGSSVETLVTLEPNEFFFRQASNLQSTGEIHKIFNLSLQDFVATRNQSQNHYDFIVVNCLLQEVDDPEKFLLDIRMLCDRNSLVWISVPNANSIHKILAKSENEFQKSSFGRKWNFTKDSLKLLISDLEGEIQFEQSRILKPLNDASLSMALELVPDFSNTLSDWLSFNSDSLFFGAELDLVIRFKETRQ